MQSLRADGGRESRRRCQPGGSYGAIFAGKEGFHAREILVENIGSSDVVALHPSKLSAGLALRRLNLMMNLGHLPPAKENRDVIGAG